MRRKPSPTKFPVASWFHLSFTATSPVFLYQRLALLLLPLRFGHFRGKPPKTVPGRELPGRGIYISSSHLIPIYITPLFYTLHFHTFGNQTSKLKNCNFQDTSLFMKCYEVLIFKVPADNFRECGAEGCCFNLFCRAQPEARKIWILIMAYQKISI